MAIRYFRLFDLLNRRGMKKSDLRQILSPKTVAKLSKGEYISGEAIEKICLFLECQPGDIMEVVEVDEELDRGTRIINKNVVLGDEHASVMQEQYVECDIDERLNIDASESGQSRAFLGYAEYNSPSS